MAAAWGVGMRHLPASRPARSNQVADRSNQVAELPGRRLFVFLLSFFAALPPVCRDVQLHGQHHQPGQHGEAAGVGGCAGAGAVVGAASLLVGQQGAGGAQQAGWRVPLCVTPPLPTIASSLPLTNPTGPLLHHARHRRPVPRSGRRVLPQLRAVSGGRRRGAAGAPAAALNWALWGALLEAAVAHLPDQRPAPEPQHTASRCSAALSPGLPTCGALLTLPLLACRPRRTG